MEKIAICKPMMLDCVSCSKRKPTEKGKNFCFEKEPCSVPWAVADIESNGIIKWIDNDPFGHTETEGDKNK